MIVVVVLIFMVKDLNSEKHLNSRKTAWNIQIKEKLRPYQIIFICLALLIFQYFVPEYYYFCKLVLNENSQKIEKFGKQFELRDN